MVNDKQELVHDLKHLADNKPISVNSVDQFELFTLSASLRGPFIIDIVPVYAHLASNRASTDCYVSIR